MWLTKLLVDIVIVTVILTAVPKLMGTMIDLARKLANSVNEMLRKMFKLDDKKAWECGTKSSETRRPDVKTFEEFY